MYVDVRLHSGGLSSWWWLCYGLVRVPSRGASSRRVWSEFGASLLSQECAARFPYSGNRADVDSVVSSCAAPLVAACALRCAAGPTRLRTPSSQHLRPAPQTAVLRVGHSRWWSHAPTPLPAARSLSASSQPSHSGPSVGEPAAGPAAAAGRAVGLSPAGVVADLLVGEVALLISLSVGLCRVCVCACGAVRGELRAACAEARIWPWCSLF